MDPSYSTIKTFLDDYVNTNNANEISGQDLNDAHTYMLMGMAGKLFDATRPYKEGQTLIKEDATFGHEIWIAPADVAAGAWAAGNFTRLFARRQKVTASDNAYSGIESGTNTYSHNIGHTDIIIQAFNSAGGLIPVNVTAVSSTKITIESNVAYSGGKILIQEIIIP